MFKSNGMIIGVDEVGMGSWAGPMLVVAFASPAHWRFGVKDSKQYSSHAARLRVYDKLQEEPDCVWCIRYKDPWEIDAVGLGLSHENAVREAIEVCLNMLAPSVPGIPERIIVDGDWPSPISGVECIPKADQKFIQVSAASVVAKVVHDQKMQEYSRQYPGYGFETNMGYGSQQHSDGLAAQGLCSIHRRSFHPMKNYVIDDVPLVPPEEEVAVNRKGGARKRAGRQKK